ncbi:MAG: hypothetical protein HYV63_31025 [Candidatus Schekmanbacteria bacterium]|nr:hypothetical protein [Candidatus Schekmanbacteria bacterium]
MADNAPSMLKPALIAGCACGVASAVPLVGLLNCACCALIIGCGLLGAYLHARSCREVGAPFGPSDGALVGLLSGVVYGVTGGLASSLIQQAFGGLQAQLDQGIEQLRAAAQGDSAEFLNQLAAALQEIGLGTMIAGAVVINLVLGAIFGTIGGLIGGSVFKIEEPAADSGGYRDVLR